MASMQTISLYAAGSLKAALGEAAASFEATADCAVKAKYGPSGLLLTEISGGAPAHVFASANMAHPQSLHRAGKSGPVTIFTRNTLCALTRPGLDVTSGSLVTVLLDRQIRVGTSTPKADPSGDYAFEVFGRAERVKSGAKAALEAKAVKLTGAADSARSAIRAIYPFARRPRPPGTPWI